MPKPEPVTPDTITNIARQLLGQPLSKNDAAAAAGMLNALAADMQAFRAMQPEDEEPATTYSAVEGEP